MLVRSNPLFLLGWKMVFCTKKYKERSVDHLITIVLGRTSQTGMGREKLRYIQELF